jgi:hypothetical protein
VSTILAIIVCAGSGGAVPVESGIAKHYDPGVFERVAAKRGLTLPPGYAGFASSRECDYRGRKDAMMGRTVIASIAGSGPLRFLVADCSHPKDRARHYRQHLVIEVEYDVAARQGWAARGRAVATLWRAE